VFGFLVFLHGAFQVFLNPLGVGVDDLGEELGLTLMGFLMTQPILFGIWAALGPGNSIRRIAATFAIFVAVCLGGAIKPLNVWSAAGESFSIEIEPLLWALGFFILAAGIMVLARKFAGWRFDALSAVPTASPQSQFGVKFLLGLTTVCAVLLAICRALSSTNASAVMFAGITLLILFPVLVLPFLMLSRKPSVRLLVVALLVWAILTWLATEAMAAVDSVSRGGAARQLVFIQLGAATASFVSAIALRLGGYVFSGTNRAAAKSRLAIVD
jgi:hypothetical protein